MRNLRRILTSFFVVGVVASAGVLASRAFFSDTETSNNNTFTAGEIDLTVGHNGDPSLSLDDLNGQAIFNYQDVKPGDARAGSFSMQVTSNDAYACIMSETTSTPENGRIDPEIEAGDTTGGAQGGELQEYLQFAFYVDNDQSGSFTSGDSTLNRNQFFGDGNGYTLAELEASGWQPLAQPGDVNATLLVQNQMTANTAYHLGYIACFGDIQADGSCEGTLNPSINQAQTDQVIGSLKFYAVQSRNNGDFNCSSLNPVEVGAVLASYNAPQTCDVTVSESNSIQTAVNGVANNSTVCVDNTYNGAGDNTAIRIETLGLTLAATTQGVDLDVPVVLSNSDVTVTGFDGVIGQAESPAEQAAFYLDADADGATISFNTVTGGSGAAILTELGASLTGGLISNNVLSGATQGIYLNPHTGLITIEYNDIDSNTAGIGNLNGALVRFNEFDTSGSLEAIGAGNGSFGDYDGSVVEYNNFLSNTRINTYSVTTNVQAPNNFFGPSGASAQTDPNVDYTPEAGSAYAHK